jgi:hypothetical protein
MKSRLLRSVFAVLLLPFPVLASLGGDATTVQADQAKMQSTLRSTSSNSYTLHEMETPAGVTVKEYVSPAGKVFAVTWQGAVHPDLRQLLGSYFAPYVQAVEAQKAERRGRGPLVIQQAGLVVQITGHMRALRGKAYVPQMLPVGVRAEDLQ